jgi:hypothetical protein
MNIKKIITALITISIIVLYHPTMQVVAAELVEDAEEVSTEDDITEAVTDEAAESDDADDTEDADDTDDADDTEDADEQDELTDEEDAEEDEEKEENDEDDSIKSSLVIQVKHYKDFVVSIDDYEFIVEDMGDYYDSDETRLSTDETVSFADFVSAAASDSDEYSFFRNEIDYSLFDSLDGIDEVYNELKSIGDIPAGMKLTIYEKDGVIENYSID